MALEVRGSLWGIAGRTTDAPRALQNLLERDRLFTELLRKEAHRLGLPVVEVAQGARIQELSRRLAGILELEKSGR